MKIVFAVTNDLVFDQRMNRICSTLTEAGFQVTLVGRRRKNSSEIVPQKYEQIRLYCPIEKGKLFYALYNVQLFLWLLFRRFDAYSAVDLDTFLPFYFLSKIKSKPLIYDAHEWFPYVPEVIGRKSVQEFWLKIEKIAIRKSDLVYTVSQGIALEFQKVHSKNVGVIRNMPLALPTAANTIEVNDFNLPSQRFILYQGALNEGRGLELLFSVLSKTDYHLVVAGEGDLSEKLRDLALKLGLQNQIHFLGFVAPKMLPQLTCKAFVGYNLSENKGLSYYHSLNNKFFDYVQAELPSIINDFPEYRALCGEYTVGLLTEHTETAVLKNLKLFFDNSEIYDRAKMECQRARLVWTWENESVKLVEMYRTLLK